MNTELNGILPFVVIVMPPGSTSDDLQGAINIATSGDIIEISSDIDFSSVVTVPAGLTITIQSNDGNNWTLSQLISGDRHFTVNGELILENVTLYGGTTFNADGTVLDPGAGGIQVNSDGLLFLDDGAVIRNCYSPSGGGINSAINSVVTVNGGSINSNAADNGGGIFASGDITLYNGSISDNTASITGGGIYSFGASVTIGLNGGTITANRAMGGGAIGGDGGGVYADQPSSTINLNGSTISENTALNGGGIMSNGTVDMTSGSIMGNRAAFGGGVYMQGFSIAGPTGIFILHGGQISGNRADNGGGIYARGNLPGVSLTVNGGTILDNEAIRGGGVYLAFEPGGASSLTLDSGAISGNRASVYGGGVYAADGASMTMTGGVIGGATVAEGNTAPSGGGVYVTGANADFTMTGGVISFNTASVSNYGGGGVFIDGSNFTMRDGAIRSNTANGDGGGVYIFNNNSLTSVTTNTFTMENGTISGNTATRNGGGLYLNAVNQNISVFNMVSGAITGNTATNGGGIYGAGNSMINIQDGTVSGNTAASNGGGIYVVSASTLSISSNITNNRAGVDGGGIFTQAANYSNLATGSATVFSGNTASVAHTPPADASTLYPNIQFASTSIANHPLNNFDINFTSGVALTFFVSYNANGGVGSHTDTDIPYGTAYTILSPAQAGISRQGFCFTNWNTQPDGSGASYSPGNVIIIANNLTLYAQWRAESPCPPPCTPCRPCFRLCFLPCRRCCRQCTRTNQGNRYRAINTINKH